MNKYIVSTENELVILMGDMKQHSITPGDEIEFNLNGTFTAKLVQSSFSNGGTDLIVLDNEYCILNSPNQRIVILKGKHHNYSVYWQN
ncbi:hypothetical protein VVYB158_06510 [Vibrio vulnificus CladeA-yb158]|uniref:hypothetical protein n=1 Tax=Vibrio vulnificus TaxID=672 RepID=UPI00063DB450|nr:hypothetical protein [Vibrio vulnificus]KLI68658.1 hypothetical protein VVYB158_06510 [Vibrio vulnificus CladeA-yb158]